MTVNLPAQPPPKVRIEAPKVSVMMPEKIAVVIDGTPPKQSLTKRVERDKDGNIIRIVEEP